MENISSVCVTPLTGYGNLKALASLNYKGVILRGMTLREKDNTLWLGMPCRKSGEKWEDIYFFSNAEIRKTILDAVLEKYKVEILQLR